MNSFSLKANRKYPSLPGVGQTVESHVPLLELMSQGMATHERRTKDVLSSFVRVQELIDLGIARKEGDRIVLSLPASSGGVATALADLTDVDVSGVSDGDALVYESGSGLWLPMAVSGGGGGSANITPDTHPSSPDAMDDEFEDGALDAKWSWVNQGSAAATLSRGALTLTTPANQSQTRIIEQALSGAAWRFRAKLWAEPGGASIVGFSLRESGSGQMMFPGLIQNPGPGTPYTWMAYVNGFGSPSTYIDLNDVHGYSGIWEPGLTQFLPQYHELELSGGTVTLRLSKSGMDNSFVQVGAISLVTAGFSGNPDGIGLCVHSFSSGPDPFLFVDWIRRFA